MKIGAIIQARMGSTRLSGKVMKKIADRTVLEHVIERVSQSRFINTIVIATTTHERDNVIEEEAIRCGVKHFRGSEDDVLSRYYYAARENDLDVVIRITSDCPLIDPNIIDEIVEFFLKNDFDIVSNAGPKISDRTYPRGLDTEVFSFRALEKAFNSASEKYQREHVTPYIYESSEKVYFYKNENDYSRFRWTLDTDDDLRLISEIYKDLYRGKQDFYMEEIIKLFEQNPELYNINAHVEQKKIQNTSKGKIILLKGESQYNVLRHACDLIANGFEENGYRTKVLDAVNFTTVNELYETIKKEMTDNGVFIFSYNLLFHNLILENNISFYEFMGYPVFGFLVDHPCYHHIRLNNTSGDNIYIGCVDWNRISYINRYYPKHKHVNFIPHFSFRAKKFISYEEKKNDIYFPGSYNNPESYKLKIQNLPKVFADIILAVIPQLTENIALTLEEVLRKYLASINFEYTGGEFAELMDVVGLAELYLRDYYRDKIIRSILSTGLPLLVCGKGWLELKEVYQDQLTIVGDGGLDIEDNVDLISESKIIINIFTSIKNGTHERIFTAMRNYCICFTDGNKYLIENFSDGENIVLFDINKIEEIPEKIKWLLDNADKAKTIAENGYQIACNEYDDKHTARRVLDIMGLD